MIPSVVTLEDGDYVVETDLPPWAVTRVGLEIFRMWQDFALGMRDLGSGRIAYPTGRYASAIQYRAAGVGIVAVAADEGVAPYAAWIESGHKPFDMKTVLQQGRGYPMHRPPGKGRLGTRRIGAAGPATMRRSIWGRMRSSTFSGFASIGKNAAADSWIIPEMPAYSPALNLALAAARMAGES